MKRDKFTRKAFSEGYSARSVYKLKAIQKRFEVIKSGDFVLDIGAAPGSWSEYVLELGGEVDSVDVVKLKGFIQVDIMSDDIYDFLKEEYDVVLSDVAPKTIGVRSLDNELSYDLSKRALEIASKVLKRNGKFVCKIFQSEFSDKFVKEVRVVFKGVKVVKPEGSKKRSKEFYVVGLRKK
ncbi:RlmE family RNA methyltransferase [archaeon]|nr:RlmE family RNA methyltransferase [archaeon]